jgi:GT2 family glycosyltransferase
MLLNSDTEVGAGSLKTLVGYLDAHPDVGACGPLLRHPDGSVQKSCFSYHSPLRHLADMLALGRIFPGTRLENLNTRFSYARTSDVDWLIGAALVVPASVVGAVRMLDERFRIHGNDSDWCFRIHRAGYRIAFVAEAEVLHHGGATLSIERQRTDLERELIENLFAYHRKHFGWIGYAWLRLWLVIGYGARSAVVAVKEFARGTPSADGVRVRRLFLAGLRRGGEG